MRDHDKTAGTDYVKHVKHPHGKVWWCGPSACGFGFLDIDHAVANDLAEGRLLPCPKCWAAITAAVSRVVVGEGDTDA